MGQPTAYNITTDFSSEVDAGTVGATNINSTKVDTELNNVETTLDSILVNIALSQADDGSPKDDWVDLPSLADDVINFVTTNGNGWYATDTGSVNTMVVTLDPIPTSLTNGMFVVTDIKLTSTSTAVTLNVNGLGAKVVVTDGAGAVPSVGALTIGTFYGFQYDLSADKFQIVFSGDSITQATAAASSATAAASSATSASSSATSAASSATASASSATAAASSATAAASSATASASSATAAAASETAAETAETNAETAETNAETAETNAETAQTAAETAAGTVAWQFKFDTSTSMADPGAGDFRMDSATVSAVRNIAFDATLSSTSTPDISAYIATWGASTSTIKGHLTIIQEDTPANFIVFSISSAVADNTGWLQVVVNAAVASGGSLFGSTKECRVTFTRTGDKGTTGDTGARGSDAGLDMTFESTTTDTDQGVGKVWFNNGTLSSASVLYMDDVDANSASINSWVDSWDDSTTTALRGTVKIVQQANPAIFAIYSVTGAVTSSSTYSKIPVSYITGAGSFTDADASSVSFFRTGNTGSAGSSTPADNVFRIQDNGDNTKQIAFEASGIGSGVTRTITMPNSDVTLGTPNSNTVDSVHYVDGSIDNEHIADNAIDSEHYADGSIDNAHIADDAIDSEHYADGSIDEAHIADNAVTLAKMAGGTDGQIITFDASGDPVAVGPGSDGEVLTSTGAGSPPAFEAAAGGEATYVQFPATQVASADANRLDDYEEGTFTPILNGASTTTYTTQNGQYVKIGQFVWINFTLQINSLGDGSTSTFAGLPFTPDVAMTSAPATLGYNATLAVNIVSLNPFLTPTTTTGSMRGRTAAAASISVQAVYGNGARTDISACYQIA
jgi:hypothetical protein